MLNIQSHSNLTIGLPSWAPSFITWPRCTAFHWMCSAPSPSLVLDHIKVIQDGNPHKGPSVTYMYVKRRMNFQKCIHNFPPWMRGHSSAQQNMVGGNWFMSEHRSNCRYSLVIGFVNNKCWLDISLLSQVIEQYPLTATTIGDNLNLVCTLRTVLSIYWPDGSAEGKEQQCSLTEL